MGDQGVQVYVSNIDWRTSNDELRDHMSTVGEAVFADIFQDRDGRSKGIALVGYASDEEAQRAIRELDGSHLGGRDIYVREDRGKGKGKNKDSGKSGGWDYGKGGGRDYGRGGKDYGKGGGYFGGGGGGYFGGDGGRGYDEGGKGYRDGGKGGKGFGGKGGGKGKLDERDRGRVLRVGNLPDRTSWQSVKDVFREYGSVIRVDFVEDGVATVLFEKEDDARAAIPDLDGADFEGRAMEVCMEDNF